MINKIYHKKILGSAVFIVVVGLVLFFALYRNPYPISQEEIRHFNSIYTENQSKKTSYSLRVISIPDAGTTEGAEMSVYFDKNDGSTKIIEVSYGGETYHLQHNYYFDDIDDIVLIEKYERWDRPYSEEGRKKTNDETSKYYFHKLQMVFWIDSKGKIVNPQSGEFKQKQNQVLPELEKLLGLIEK